MFKSLKIQIFFDRIVFNFCDFDFIIKINFIDATNLKIINFMFTSRNIHNLKTQSRRKFLQSLTFIQALIQKFDQKN